MAEPTDDQLRDYIKQMPQIYKDVLAAFPEIAPTRRRGEGISSYSVAGYVIEQENDYRLNDVYSALDELAKKGVVIEKKIPPASTSYFDEYASAISREMVPTSIGERIIEQLTGKKSQKFELPQLPEFTWS